MIQTRVLLYEASVTLQMTYEQAGTLLSVVNNAADAAAGIPAAEKLLLSLAPVQRAFLEVQDKLVALADEKSAGGIILIK